MTSSDDRRPGPPPTKSWKARPTRTGAPPQGRSGPGAGRSGPTGGSRAPKQAPRDSWADIPKLYGHHAVAFALANPARIITHLMLTDNAERKLEAELALRHGSITIERVTPRDLDKRLGADTVHQGACAEVEPLDSPDLDTLIAGARDTGPIVVLDQVTDPHNVGAILRSAAVFGCVGVVVTRRNSPPLHGALAKAASGALDLIPVCLVQNLGRALEDLGKAGVHRLGFEGTAPTALHSAQLDGAIALVMGAEGKGLRASTAEACDELVRIATGGPISSLNVSNAAAVGLHMAALKRLGSI